MLRKLARTLTAAACLSLAACGMDPAGPHIEAGPQLLIGDSPLQPISLDRTTDPPMLRVPVELGTNGAKVGDLDRFFVQSTIGIWDVHNATDPLGNVRTEEVIDDPGVDEGLRIGACIELVATVALDGVWAKIESKREVRVVATVALVLESRDGGRKVLDSMTREGTVEPKDAAGAGGK